MTEPTQFADYERPPRPDFTRRTVAFAQALGLTLDHLYGLLESYDLRLIDGLLRCENCGKTMAEHDAMAHCWPAQIDGNVSSGPS